LEGKGGKVTMHARFDQLKGEKKKKGGGDGPSASKKGEKKENPGARKGRPCPKEKKGRGKGGALTSAGR